ncbi:MerR family transcriptional regulator [Nocardia salmonicida]|uniref:MerR family transcriptional regulator n=1 Tax=Nocardia salmonicida TaxID=53431 RepID=UPI0007A4F4C9|nr:MerR family transcriptional regulator [Nocardia salmonicida]
MRIGELARRTGVSARALRYYEQQNLLRAERSSSGQRQYSDTAVDQVLLIQQLYAAGLSSRTIGELTPHLVNGRATPALLGRLEVERDHLRQSIIELERTEQHLDSVISAVSANVSTGAVCGRETWAQGWNGT